MGTMSFDWMGFYFVHLTRFAEARTGKVRFGMLALEVSGAALIPFIYSPSGSVCLLFFFFYLSLYPLGISFVLLLFGERG
jgi:hypothetical protein